MAWLWLYLVSYHISDLWCCIHHTQVAEVGAYAETTGVLFQATVRPWMLNVFGFKLLAVHPQMIHLLFAHQDGALKLWPFLAFHHPKFITTF